MPEPYPHRTALHRRRRAGDSGLPAAVLHQAGRAPHAAARL